MKKIIAVIVAATAIALIPGSALAAGPRYCGSHCALRPPVPFTIWYAATHHNR